MKCSDSSERKAHVFDLIAPAFGGCFDRFAKTHLEQRDRTSAERGNGVVVEVSALHTVERIEYARRRRELIGAEKQPEYVHRKVPEGAGYRPRGVDAIDDICQLVRGDSAGNQAGDKSFGGGP